MAQSQTPLFEPALRFCLLGGLRIECIGRAVALESRKHLALVAYLAVTGTPQPRDKLAGLFWGDWPNARARRYLSRAVWDANRHLSLDPPVLLATAPALAINRQCHYELDVEVFERRAAAIQATPGASAADLQAAIALYEGDFLDGFCLASCPEFEMWLLERRARLHDEAVQVLARLVALHGARGREGLASGIACARRLLELDPWHEEGHRSLMRLLALNGQRGAAIEQYERCRSLLAQELGVAPQPETEALYRRVAAGEIGSTPL